MKKGELAITIPEYNRIFQVIHSVSTAFDDRSGVSCLFYNTVGAFLLEKSLGVAARAVMGAAFFRVDDATNTILCFGDCGEDGVIKGTQDGFHCWVETESHIIDFTAPMYRKYLTDLGGDIKLPRKMFQKRKELMAQSHENLNIEGDYFVESNPELSLELALKGARNPEMGDLADACLKWFKRPPKKIRSSLPLMSNHGQLIEIKLTGLSVLGAW
ncbi:hypothetical protein C4K24_4020 [Pseudomonas chlororaphis subsp. aurantiaca]|uniref:DUF2026 family protein n=1 Tax=Pseudomonas chlororaphis TaxID=587753 RepID=UPI000F55AF8C|nr:DUF2026 family protein [Pseudomonas chlororaphis]AZD23315.1 hypothetical protein C4K24_4020 [Pseudomonas chlororaphis subsp. aurantiaca]